MNRRSLLSSIAGFLPASMLPASAAPTKPEPCLTPAYAGFDGSFLLYGGGSARRYTVRLLRCSASSPKRWGLDNGRLAYWYNDDKSVSKLLWRNRDGKLFDLQFVPMEEPA